MKYEHECPACETEFEIKEWKNGQCPKCRNKYQWDSQEIKEKYYEDEWIFPVFENSNPILNKFQWINSK